MLETLKMKSRAIRAHVLQICSRHKILRLVGFSICAFNRFAIALNNICHVFRCGVEVQFVVLGDKLVEGFDMVGSIVHSSKLFSDIYPKRIHNIMIEQIQLGDVVADKNGHLMTVVRYLNEERTIVECCWFEKSVCSKSTYTLAEVFLGVPT